VTKVSYRTLRVRVSLPSVPYITAPHEAYLTAVL
jgi:hypothetical protein